MVASVPPRVTRAAPVRGRPPWPRSGADPAPLPGVCQVWWARPGDVRPEHDALLGEADLERRARLVRPADRQRMTAGAVVARLVLGAALGTPPADLRIVRTCAVCGSPHARPRLAEPGGPEFSMASAGHCVAVAVLLGGAVGVAVAERTPGAAEPAVPRVRRQAVLEVTDQGLDVPVEALVLTPPPVLHRHGQEPVWLRDLPAPRGFLAALAGPGTAPDVVVHRDAGALLRQTSRRLPGATTRSQR
jgi:4'-phosphopantetheinyl transferase